jgi:hypothetical protein
VARKRALLPANDVLIGDIRKMIDEARGSVALSVNAALTSLYWHIGQDILKEKRVEYGAEIVATIGRGVR